MIEPLGNRILIEVEEPKAGALNIDIPVAQEQGKVIAIGKNWDHKKEPLKKGDIIHFKSWGADIIQVEGKKYIYVNQDTKAVCALVRQHK